MPRLQQASIVVAALVLALIAGFFYAYAVSVARGLGRLPDAGYVAAMQSINATVRTPLFALSFFGALVVLPAAAALHARGGGPRLWWLAAAAGLYAIGGFGVTFAASVPLNDELAALDLVTAAPLEVARARADYEGPWNAWNAVRTVAATLAVACVAAAALSRPGPRRARGRAASRPATSP